MQCHVITSEQWHGLGGNIRLEHRHTHIHTHTLLERQALISFSAYQTKKAFNFCLRPLEVSQDLARSSRIGSRGYKFKE